ncbi:MAG: SIMPL domain-containing protein [Ignavibacterium sp.]|nr:SIMPL domain-containing protein [Ignavibacterium sp.]
MKKIILILFTVCFISTNAQENQKYININGTSELIRDADLIDFTIEIKTIDESVEKSKKTNDNNLKELLEVLKTFGISSEDIKVSPIRLGKNFEYNERERQQIQKGFFVELEVSFLLRDLTKYYELTNKLATSDAFAIVRSTYGISDYELQHKIAYENALRAAKEKAEYMVKSLGLNLGDVLEIDENNLWQSYPNPTNTITMESSQVGSIAGKVTLRRSIRVKFAIN